MKSFPAQATPHATTKATPLSTLIEKMLVFLEAKSQLRTQQSKFVEQLKHHHEQPNITTQVI